MRAVLVRTEYGAHQPVETFRRKEREMAKNALDVLREAGTPIEALSDAEREVFASLDPNEVSVLTSIQSRINTASSAVVGQLPPDNTNVVC